MVNLSRASASDVLAEIGPGRTNDQIAKKLGIMSTTVKSYLIEHDAQARDPQSGRDDPGRAARRSA